VVPIRPSVNGHEIYYTCFNLIVQHHYRAGHAVCYRTARSFAFLRSEHSTGCLEYEMFINGQLNIDAVPRNFNYCLGYSDNEALPTMNQMDIVKTGDAEFI